MNFQIASKITSLFAATTGSGVSSVLLNETIDNAVETTNSNAVWNTFLTFLLNFFGEILLAVGKFALGFIDLIQFIVYKFLGVNFNTNYAGYDPNNPIIKFLSNDTVLRVLRSMLAVGAVLVILFSIYAIIRGEYARAVNNSEYNAKRVVARALRSMFGMVIFPILFLVIVILTNAVASSFAQAITKNPSASIGGQIMTTAAYGANNYRKYASNDYRIPISINFNDPYNDGVAFSRYTEEELALIYEEFAPTGRRYYNMFANQSYLSFAESVKYNSSLKSISNSKSYNEFENFVCTAEQYYVMADFMDYALMNGLTFYYKYIGDEDIDWKYVNSTVYDKENKILTITYKDANKVYSLDDGEKSSNPTYTVSYAVNEYKITSPVQDALTTLGVLLSLDTKDQETLETISGEIFKTIEHVQGSINQVQWKTNKVRLKLSNNYDTIAWTDYDRVLLYEFYRYQYNNTLGNYTIADLINGIDMDLYMVYPQFYRSYTGKYVDLTDGELCAVLNGNYYKVTKMYDNDGKLVVDDYGDPIYTLDAYPAELSNLTSYNQTHGTEIGTNIPNHGWYSATYDPNGNALSQNTLSNCFVNTVGIEIEPANVDTGEPAKYGFYDANGIPREVDRIKVVQDTKTVSFPVKLTNDLQTIYRNLNLEQLVTTGEWLSAFSSNVEVVDGKYVASFDTSLITPQGLIFSEIFLGEIVESENDNLGNFIFKSKYSDAQIRALMIALLGEEYYETAKTTIESFVETFNLLFEPLIERIMNGENQQMKVGEIESIQLYTYKAYLASVLLSSDSAQFFLNIARSLIGMYKFNYNISIAEPDEDTFVNNVLEEYYNNAEYSADGEDGKLKYIVDMSVYDINWIDYFTDAEDYSSFTDYLHAKFPDGAPTAKDIPEPLNKEIYNIGYNTYKTYAELIIDEIISGRTTNGYRVDRILLALEQCYENEDNPVTSFGDIPEFNYDSDNFTINLDSKYHTYKQIPNYDALAEEINKVSQALIENEGEYYEKIVEALTTKSWQSLIDESKNSSWLVSVYRNAVVLLNKQNVTSESSSSWPQYLKMFKKYVSGTIDREEIVLSSAIIPDNVTNYVNQYPTYAFKLEQTQNTVENDFSHFNTDTLLMLLPIFDLTFEGVDPLDSDLLSLYVETDENRYYFAGISTDFETYNKQVKNIEAHILDVQNYIRSIEDNDIQEISRFGKQDIVSALTKYTKDLKSLFDTQKIVDGLSKYFITFADRMVTTETVSKSFNVVVNNHSYELTLTMPTAKLTEYIVGGRYLSNIGFETAYTSQSSKGFFDLDYEEELPLDGEVEFKTLNKFFSNLANITLQSYYMSNLQNLTAYSSTNEFYTTSIKDLKYDSTNLIDKMYKFVLDNYKEALDLDYDSTYTLEQNGNDFIKSFNKMFADIIGGEENTNYASMTIKELRLEMMDSIVNYQKSSALGSDKDTERFIALFNLFCADFKSGEYEIDIMTRSVVLRLAGISDLADSNLVDLKYQHLYDDISYDENNGDYFIICTKDESTGLYVPFLMSNMSDDQIRAKTEQLKNKTDEKSAAMRDSIQLLNSWQDNFKIYNTTTSYYVASDTIIAYPIIAKGLVTDEYLPTAIRQSNGRIEFYRDNLVVRNTSELGLETYFLSADIMSLDLNFVSSLVNGVAKLFTGKSLIERACETIPRLAINANVSLPFGVDNVSFVSSQDQTTMDYSFTGLGGIEVKYFYNLREIDFFTMYIAIIALLPIMIKALFGVFGRVLDITLYYVMSPVMFSTLALGKDVTDDKGKNSEESKIFSEWWQNIIKKTISVFSYIFAFQVFFILVPYIKENMNVFADNSAFANLPVFNKFSVEFINNVLKLILIICSAYLVTEAPKLIASILGQEDGIAQGANIQNNVKSTLKDVQSTLNGQKLVNTVNYAKESLKDMTGVNAIKDATGKIKKVGAKVVSKGAEFALRAKGVSKEQAKKITGQYYNSIKSAEDNKKAIRDERKYSAQSAYLKQVNSGDILKNDIKNVDGKLKSARGKVSELLPEDWKKQYKAKKKKK